MFRVKNIRDALFQKSPENSSLESGAIANLPENPKEEHESKVTSISASKLNLIGAGENYFFIENDVVVRGDIKFKGVGNTIALHAGVTIKGEINIQGDGNKVIIESGAVVRGQILVKGKNQQVKIGRMTTFQSLYLLCQEGCDVIVGHSCMFSRDIEIRTTDAHSVIDLDSGDRINKPESITVGDHVWVGVGSLLSKGAQVPDDSIVGARSFVNHQFFESNVILAGVPAKVVKTGITWHRSRKNKFSNAEMNAWKDN
jgi:carbonic anhydrase/acetyltransferase-like protein (isoleucine patch superfamily)